MAYSDSSFPSILALSTSIGAYHLSQFLLLSYSTENPQTPLINLFILLLLYILVPITFLLGMANLICSVVDPSNSPRGEIYAVQTNHLAKVAVVMALLTFLVGMVTGVYVACPDAIGAWWFAWW